MSVLNCNVVLPIMQMLYLVIKEPYDVRFISFAMSKYLGKMFVHLSTSIFNLGLIILIFLNFGVVSTLIVDVGLM